MNPATAAAKARIDKGGASDDFASQLLYYPDERVAIIWASNNLRQRWRHTLNKVLPDIVFGNSVLSLPRVAKLPRAHIRSYAGGGTWRAETVLFCGSRATICSLVPMF